MSRPLRIGFGRIAQETNAFSVVATTVADFGTTHLLEGAELLEVCEAKGTEVPGFTKAAELSGFVTAAREQRDVEPVPLFSAWAIPGGPLTADCLAELTERLVLSIRAAGPLDGLLLSMHGAMGAEGSDDPEADVMAAVRAEVGPDLPIGVTLDLHAQLGARFVDATTFLAGYRTNPHRDHHKVGLRAGCILIRAARGEVELTTAWRSLPLVLGGGTTIDFLPTMRPIYRWMRRVEKDPRVLYLSLFNAHLWCDSDHLGWASHVVTDGDPALAERLADELAQRLWDVRHRQPPSFPTASETIRQVRGAWLRRKLGTVCVCDASDIVGAGAAGENTRLLKALLEEAQGLRCYAPIRDAETVRHLWDVEVGQRFDTSVGGRLDPQLNAPTPIRGRVLGRREHTTFGPMMWVDLDHVSLVITSGPPLAMRPSFYGELGLNPWRADLVVVKSMFPFRWYFLPHNRKTIYTRTEGVTDFDHGLRRSFAAPVHPKDPVQDWRPTDRLRRGLPRHR
ncbi:MAG: M81 family metallopeptidase [Proteobacteria bacterium]|nr:M81 family metallopeptidase [Pseudomonadota bacterium]